MVSIGLFLMAVSAGSVIMVAVANVDAGGLRAASVGAGVLPALLGGPLLLAGFAGYVLRRYGGLGAADSETGRSSLGLRPGERAVWTGRGDRRRSAQRPDRGRLRKIVLISARYHCTELTQREKFPRSWLVERDARVPDGLKGTTSSWRNGLAPPRVHHWDLVALEGLL
jgi:hypothetical protein